MLKAKDELYFLFYSDWNRFSFPGAFQAMDQYKRGRVNMNIMQVKPTSTSDTCDLVIFIIISSFWTNCTFFLFASQFLMLSMNVWGEAESEPAQEQNSTDSPGCIVLKIRPYFPLGDSQPLSSFCDIIWANNVTRCLS